MLFLADGRRARVVGFNEQWTQPGSPGCPFLYGGAVGTAPLPESDADHQDRLDALVTATGLVGLNGLDFLLRRRMAGRCWSSIRAPPRRWNCTIPTIRDGLFDAHLRACHG